MKAEANLIRLVEGPLELLVAPQIGGSIAAFNFIQGSRKHKVFRGSDRVPETVLAAGSFPLVPYSNRIRAGRFSFRGKEVTLSENMEGDPSPLHGDGWLAAWDAVHVSDRDCELVFSHSPGEWPWAYEARQLFELDSSGLTLALMCRNLSDEPMPCGLGQHPYFTCTPETLIDTEVTDAWTIDENVLPVERVPATGRYDLRNRTVCGQDLDNGFGGWGQSCRIHTPGAPFRILFSSPDVRFFQLYSPVEGGLFVAEPVSHANAALNEPEERWPELGLRVIGPGEEMSLTVRFEIVPA